MRLRNLATAVLAAAALVALPGGAEAAQDGSTSFVVNTQFRDGPSPIVAATGALAACTTAEELPGSLGIQTGPRTILFTGTKELDCNGGTVIIAYQATLNQQGGRKTFGTWQVQESNLPGVMFGGGRLTGDAARCELLAGSEGCILDTFTGRVFAS
jgi:hypothetical protein